MRFLANGEIFYFSGSGSKGAEERHAGIAAGRASLQGRHKWTDCRAEERTHAQGLYQVGQEVEVEFLKDLICFVS